MGKINSRTKGKVGERELSKELKALYQLKARRGQQYNGLEGEDVVGIPDVHIECKRVENLSIYPAMAQATKDAAAGSIPCVMHRRNHKGWLVTVKLADLKEFSERFLRAVAKGQEDDGSNPEPSEPDNSGTGTNSSS